MNGNGATISSCLGESEAVPNRWCSVGHANAATTLGVYAHFVEESDREAAEKIGSILAPSAWGRARK